MNEVCRDWTDWEGTIKICGGMTHGQVVSQSQWCGDGSEWYGCVWTQQEPAKSVEASGTRVMLQKP